MDENLVMENVVDVVDDTIGMVDVVPTKSLPKSGKIAIAAAGIAALIGITAIAVKKLKKKNNQHDVIDITPKQPIHDGESVVEDLEESKE